MRVPRPHRAAELVARLAEQQQHLALGLERARGAAGDVVEDPEHADDRGRQDRRVAGAVVEGHVAAGDGDAELAAAVGQTAAGLGERPHHLGVLGGAEVQAVGHGHRHRAGRGDVAAGLGQRQLRAGVGVEGGEAARTVQRHRDADVGVLVEAQHAGVVRHRQHGVAQHVPVVLLGDPAAGADVGRRDQRQQLGPQVGRARQVAVRQRRAGRHRTLVDGPVLHQ